MSSRNYILQQVQQSQPAVSPLPPLTPPLPYGNDNPVHHFVQVLQGIGGRVIWVNEAQELAPAISQVFENQAPIATTLPHLPFSQLEAWPQADSAPRVLHKVAVAVLPAAFGVAESGAVWLTEQQYQIRVLPFICQHLAIVVSRSSILPTMHHAYAHIAHASYGFGVFIAGPSKTADIEQSLVLGAHGPRTMTVFLMP